MKAAVPLVGAVGRWVVKKSAPIVGKAGASLKLATAAVGKRFGKCWGGVCPCFVAGTLIALPAGAKAIDQVQVGDRVMPSSERCESTEIDDSVVLTLQMPGPDGDSFAIQLLRPRAWVTSANAVVGSDIYLVLGDLNVEGWAKVLSLERPAPIEPATGCVVTGTIAHTSHDVIALSLSDNSPALEVTAHHRLFSASRNDWVAAGDLHEGELLATQSGTVAVRAIDRHPQAPEPVFNLEIADGHRYFVGQSEVLAHNQYTKLADEAAEGAERGVFSVGPYRPSATPLENHHGVLDVWASRNVPGYVSRGANTPTIALTEAQHAATKDVYRDWLFEQTGRKVGGSVNWSQVSAREMQSLTNRMFDAAGVPAAARVEYFRAFHQYVYGVAP